MNSFSISGLIVDPLHRRIFHGTVAVQDGKITSVTPLPGEVSGPVLMPGFVDAHVHVESSMLIPSEFARLAVVHGTVATVSDPHEIGNVLGVDGVRYMIRNGKEVPFKFYFGAPSCVPATTFETAGATITAEDIRSLFEDDGLVYLSEMMNFPGVLFQDPVVMEKLRIAQELGRRIDGHAPGLRGDEARRYAAAGPSTDHECFTLEEALDKLACGMNILIREGSAAKNYEALKSIIATHTAQAMLCSDDKHPNDLADGHINTVVRRALKDGFDLMDVLQCACVNPVQHYGLNVGLLQPGDPADFIVLNSLEQFSVRKTYIDGKLVAENGVSLIERVEADTPNVFAVSPVLPEQFRVPAGSATIRVIEALDGQLVTNELHLPAPIQDGEVVASVEQDILKLVVVNRYADEPPAIAFIKNFGLKRGAIASCVAHDSHNIIAVGTNDDDLCTAINGIIGARGGVSVAHHEAVKVLPLPVAGIMTTDDGYRVAEQYAHLDRLAKELGSPLASPFMTLSFMALLVIPALKLSDKGLFDGAAFAFVPVDVA